MIKLRLYGLVKVEMVKMAVEMEEVLVAEEEEEEVVEGRG